MRALFIGFLRNVEIFIYVWIDILHVSAVEELESLP